MGRWYSNGAGFMRSSSSRRIGEPARQGQSRSGGRPMKLEGRIALVTGASRGRGRAIAIEFAREGADVAVNYRKQAAGAEDTAKAIRGSGRRAVVIQTDIS